MMFEDLRGEGVGECLHKELVFLNAWDFVFLSALNPHH